MAFLFANNVNTTLAAAATSTQTTLSLTSTVGIPTTIPSGDYFAMTLNDAATRSVFEVVYVTAVSGSNVTVLRGQEGTTANSWLSGDYIYGALTAGEIADFAFVSGSETQPFAVAPASASAPQNAPQYGQMFDLQAPSASGSITLSALRTVVIPTATSAITLTIQPGTTAGQWCEIVGTASGVTVQSSASSGSPYFAMPDGSVPYSFTLSSAGASLVLIWDGTNWRTQTIGQTVVAATTANNQAPPLSQIKAQFAALNGNANQPFSANNFYGFGVFYEPNDCALVCNDGNTASVNYANNAYIPHSCANASSSQEAVTLGQLQQYYPQCSYTNGAGTDTTISIEISFTTPCQGVLLAIASTNTGGPYSGNGVTSELVMDGTTVSSDSTTVPQSHSGAINISGSQGITVTYTGGSVSSFDLHLTVVFIPTPGGTV